MFSALLTISRPASPSRARSVAFLTALVALAACGDVTTAPEVSIDRVAAARVMPTVLDARVRSASEIQNQAIRDRVEHDLRELETALTNGDGQKARFHVRVLGSVLADYRAQQGDNSMDGADVSAITLTLHQVSGIVNAGFELPTKP